jgi:hypothetical protein
MAFSVALLSLATRAIGIASRMIYLGGIRNKGPDQTHLDAAVALVCQRTRTVATAPAAACANTIAHGAKKPSLWRPRNAKSASGSKRSRACCAQCTLISRRADKIGRPLPRPVVITKSRRSLDLALCSSVRIVCEIMLSFI